MDPNEETPWDFIVQVDFDRGKCTILWKQDSPTPLRWSATFGEFLYDLRSALDQIAWQLVLANGETPGSHTEFPVFHTEADFDARAPKKMRGMSDPARAAIRESQPYNAWPEHPTSATLWSIHDLCNTDKHRLLNLTDPWLFTMRVTFLIPGAVDQSFIRCTKRPERMRLQDEAVIAEFEWDPPAMRAFGEANVQVQITASLDVALAEGEWATEDPDQPGRGMAVSHFMEVSLDYVEATLLPRLEPLL